MRGSHLHSCQAGRLVLVPERYPSPRQIVRRHFNRHPVAREDADAEAAHVAAEGCQHVVTVGQLHPERGVREHLSDGALELNRVFFRHPLTALVPEG